MTRRGVLLFAVLAVLPLGTAAAGKLKPTPGGLGAPESPSFSAKSQVIPIELRKGVVQRGKAQPLERGQRDTFAVDLVDIWTPAHVARIMEGGGKKPTPLTTFVMLDDSCLSRTDIFETYRAAHFFLAPPDSPLRKRLGNPGDYICKAGTCTLSADSFDFDKKHPPFE